VAPHCKDFLLLLLSISPSMKDNDIYRKLTMFSLFKVLTILRENSID
jgi:hypothetical protein